MTSKVPIALAAVIVGASCSAQAPHPWTEAEILARFNAQSPQAREWNARVHVTEAEARARAVISNPAISYAREGAGYNEFFEVSQTLPTSGRVRYLRDAGTAAVAATDAAKDAALWQMRTDLRVAYQRMTAAQSRAAFLDASRKDIEQWTTVLADRERLGEGSRYDRLRAERELAELRVEASAIAATLPAFAARIAAYLPEGTSINQVRPAISGAPSLTNLIDRALNARLDLRAERKNLARYEAEERAAGRLKKAEPSISAGYKRADTSNGVTANGVVFSLSVPLQVFNDGRYEVARYSAEQERVRARIALLEREIKAEVDGAIATVELRRKAAAALDAELTQPAEELIRIAKIAYDEGEAGILEVLDSLRLRRNAGLKKLEMDAALREAFLELERAVGEELEILR